MNVGYQSQEILMCIKKSGKEQNHESVVIPIIITHAVVLKLLQRGAGIYMNPNICEEYTDEIMKKYENMVG